MSGTSVGLWLPVMSMGRYRLSRRLGEGGMAKVFLAYDEEMRRAVAVKVVDSREFDLRRFQREVETIGSLTHEHILPVFDYGEQDEWRYLVMQYVEGGTLRERLQNGALAPEEANSILQQVASALQFAHARGVIHRDIKPSNILLRGNYAYLADFGLARSLDISSSLTKNGTLLGTPEYMAPELANGETTTSVDIYALGIVLYQMLTGRVPFSGNSVLAIYWKHFQEAPIPPSRLNPAIPPTVDAVVLRALAKKPDQRFQSVAELALAFDLALESGPQSRTLTDLDVQKPEPLSNWRHGNSVIILLLALLLLFATSLLLTFVFFNGRAQPSQVREAIVQFYPSPLPTSTLHKQAAPTPMPTTNILSGRSYPSPTPRPTEQAKPTPTPTQATPTPTPTLTPTPTPTLTPTPTPTRHRHRRHD